MYFHTPLTASENAPPLSPPVHGDRVAYREAAVGAINIHIHNNKFVAFNIGQSRRVDSGANQRISDDFHAMDDDGASMHSAQVPSSSPRVGWRCVQVFSHFPQHGQIPARLMLCQQRNSNHALL